MFTAEERKSYIGGSDIAVVMGMSRWKTPLALWLEKTGEVEPEDLSKKEAVHFGIKLEALVAEEFAERNNKKVQRQPKMYVHKDYPYMVAHIDRLILNEDSLLECKTTNAYSEEWNDDGIPQEYFLQVQWYMGLTGRKLAYIACLKGGNEYIQREVQFDKEIFDILVKRAKQFWECVTKLEPPAITANDGETLQKRYPKYSEDIQEMQEMEALIALRQQASGEKQKLTKSIKEVQKEIDEYDCQIKDKIATNLGITTDKYTVTWKDKQFTSMDTEKMIKDGINPEDYRKITIKRVINIKLNKD